MRKSRIIATCLVNTGTGSVEEGESIVQSTFHDEFPEQDFDKWNADIDEPVGQNIIKVVGKPANINVKRLIEELFL